MKEYEYKCFSSLKEWLRALKNNRAFPKQNGEQPIPSESCSTVNFHSFYILEHTICITNYLPLLLRYNLNKEKDYKNCDFKNSISTCPFNNLPRIPFTSPILNKYYGYLIIRRLAHSFENSSETPCYK